MSTQKKYTFFVLIVLVNIILKAWFSGYTQFSYDEIISVKDTLLDFGHIKHESEWDNNPPFYYYCLWIWHKLIPINEFNTRLLSVIFVSFTIGFVFLFSEKYFDAKTSVYSCCLLSLSNFLTFYSQEARTYSLVLLLVVVSSILFFKYVDRPSLANLLFLSFINFLIIYSHYLAGLVIAIQYCMILFFYRKKIKSYFSIQTLFILGLIFLRFTKKQFQNIFNFNNKKDFWLKPANFDDFIDAVSQLFFNPVTTVFFAFVLIIFLYNYFSNSNERQAKVNFYCFLVGFMSVLFLFFIGTFKAVFLARYLIFAVPFATILISCQLSRLKTAGTIFFVFLMLFQLYSCKLKKRPDADYKEISAIVKLYKRKSDYVIINKRDNLILFEYYYNKYDFLKFKNIDSVSRAQNIYGINELEELQNIKFDKGSKIFLVQSFHKINTSDNKFESYLSNNSIKLFGTNYYRGIELNLFQK